MVLIHLSADHKLQVTADDAHGYFDQCLFFVEGPGLDDPDGILECAYTTNPKAHEVYVLDESDAEFTWIGADALEPDEIAEREIRKLFARD